MRPFLVFTVAALLLLQVSRLALVAWQHDRVLAAGPLGYVFLQGLRFDLAGIGYALALPALLAPLLLATRWTYRSTSLLLRGGLAGMLVLFFFLELATPPFLEEYDARPNYLFVEYLRWPGELLGTLSGAYPWQLALACLAVPLAAFGAWKLLATARVPDGPLPLFKAFLLAPGLALLCGLAARSSLGHRPANQSTVAYSSDAMVNTLPMPSFYTLLLAIHDMRRHEQGKISYGSLPYDDVLALVRADAGLPEEAFVDPAIPTLHVQLPTRPRDRPLNLVIVLEESLGAEFVGCMGGLPLTPELDVLSGEGLWLERLYATGTRSVRGIEAVVTSFLPTPAEAVVKLPRSEHGFFTLAELLRRHGYATSFMYGGEANFDNMRRFFAGNGFETIVERSDFGDPSFVGSWGVSDEDLFRRAHEEFEAKGEEPFFSLVFSSSNHSPWEFPDGAIELYEEPAATRHNAVKYADHALGEFFDLARGASYWDDTVFLVVADHNSRVYGSSLVPVERFHVPVVAEIDVDLAAEVCEQIVQPPVHGVVAQ